MQCSRPSLLRFQGRVELRNSGAEFEVQYQDLLRWRAGRAQLNHGGELVAQSRPVGVDLIEAPADKAR